MKLRTLTIPLVLFALSAPVAAEKFYFGAKGSEQSPSDAVVGVLIKETKETYVIRIVGGQMEVAKSSVTKREADGLTLRQIEDKEKQRASRVAEADHRRQQMQAAEASARRTARSNEDLDKPKEHVFLIDVDFNDMLPGYRFSTTGYDPVLHRMNVEGLRRVVEIYLRDQARRAAHRHGLR